MSQSQYRLEKCAFVDCDHDHNFNKNLKKKTFFEDSDHGRDSVTIQKHVLMMSTVIIVAVI